MTQMPYIINASLNGFDVTNSLLGASNLRICTRQKPQSKLLALLQDIVAGRWTGWPSVTFLFSYALSVWMLFAVYQVSIYLELFGSAIVLSPTVTLFVEVVAIIFIANLGHREMACSLVRSETGLVLDGINYGMSTALFALMVCHIPSAIMYAFTRPVLCATVVFVCIICVLVAKWTPLDVGKLFWICRLHGQFAITALIVIMLPFLPATIGIPAQSEVVIPEVQAERTLEANMDAAAAFFDGNWDSMSLQERIDTLAIMAAVLSDYLGVDNPPKRIVATADMDPSILGYYDHSGTGKIVINAAYLMSEDPLVALDTISHEMAHVFQWEAFCKDERPQGSSYPYGVDEKKLQEYLVSFAGAVPYESRVTEREAFEFGGHYSRIVSKKVCRRLQIDDPFDINNLAGS